MVRSSSPEQPSRQTLFLPPQLNAQCNLARASVASQMMMKDATEEEDPRKINLGHLDLKM